MSVENIQGSLNEKAVKSIEKAYEKDPKNAIVRHALSRNAISTVIYESGNQKNVSSHFSLDLKTMPVANQHMSGRCWIFAGLNVLREIVAKKCNIAKFELSQNYISLFDKIEKSNYALETIIKMCSRDHDDREFSFILHSPISDGGQWDMFVNLVKKYGILPQDAFPETYQSNNTRETDNIANSAIRHFASMASSLHKEGKDDEIRPLKDKTIAQIYCLFLNSFGVPPKTFDFEYTDAKNAYHIEKGLTPLSFFNEYIGDSIDEYQSLINSPTEDKPFMKNYTIDYLGNVVEGKNINHLNLPMERIEELIIAQLKDGNPVWFGSDVGFYRNRGNSAWDSDALDYLSEFGFDIKFSKGEMLDFWHSAMNHAMVITGVNLDEGKPTKWKIENSWGDDNGNKGYYVMSPEWFSTFVYQAVIMKKYLNHDEIEAASKEPTHLHPWDPMGTLAD